MNDIMTGPPYWYQYPYLHCYKCGEQIHLPYENLPQTDQAVGLLISDTDLLESPADEWSAVFGCRECGRVDSYGTKDIFVGIVDKAFQGRYHDDATLFLAEFPCANRSCTIPAKLYVDIRHGTEKDLAELLKSGFFLGNLSCGHLIGSVPLFHCKIRRILQRLW
jgi:hypothetical protein